MVKRAFVILVLSIMSALPLSAAGMKEVFVTFTKAGDRYYADVTRGGKNVSGHIALCNATELESLPANHTLYDDALANKAYRMILEPLEPYLRKRETVYFKAAGKIHFINLAALVANDGGRVFSRYDLRRVSDTTEPPYDSYEKFSKLILIGAMNYEADPREMIQHCRWCHTSDFQHLYNDIKPAGFRNPSFGITDDGTRAGAGRLINSKNEIKFIYKLNRFGTSVHTESAALEEMFRQEILAGCKYIMHLSTHTFTSETGSTCGLLFSGAGRSLRGEVLPYKLNDGILFADEIETFDMSNCELLVLGACNTALGTVTQEGVEGLQGAFKKAGAGTLLMTLWSVNDKATSEFMKSFYTHLWQTASKHKALALARQDIMNNPDFNDPIYWAPFVMLD